MDTTNYEQIHVPIIMFGAGGRFLKEGMEVKVSFEGEEPIIAEPPTFIEAEITYTEPGLKGDTATNTLKFATLDTGTEIKVPLFFNQGDWVKIDTRTGDYVERIKK
jgi:elongation factor P